MNLVKWRVSRIRSGLHRGHYELAEAPREQSAGGTRPTQRVVDTAPRAHDDSPMPELPDVVTYVDCLSRRVVGETVERVRIISPFFLRSFDPPVDAVEGQCVREVRRLAKRIVFVLDDELYLLIHLMIAGRFRWLKVGAKPPGRIALATIAFAAGTLAVTEASKKKRAALYVINGRDQLAAHDPGGLDVLTCSSQDFADTLTRTNRTLKRVLTDPHVFDGIGNAYSDEILHAARLSPARLTSQLDERETARLHQAARDVLTHWIGQLRAQFADRFPGPGDITAFREGFAVHGRFDQPCPVCGTPVQRIRLADNEHNYCPKCQTGGKVLKDRSLSRLLKDDWPKSIDEL